MQKWLIGINKYYCYKFCKDFNLSKTFIEIESLVNWYYRYKKNYGYAIETAYNRYKESELPFKISNVNKLLKEQNAQLEKQELLTEFEEINLGYSDDENEYVTIRGHDMVALTADGVYYDDISENWEPLPDDFRIS